MDSKNIVRSKRYDRFNRNSMSCVILVKLVNTWSPPFDSCQMGQKSILICRFITVSDAWQKAYHVWVLSECSVFYHSPIHRERNIQW